MVREEVVTKMPKGNLYLPPGCPGAHRGKKRLSFGARAASGGEAWNSNWGVKVLMGLVVPYTRKIVLIFWCWVLYASTAPENCRGAWMLLLLCLWTDCISRAGKKRTMGAGCKITSLSLFPPRWNDDYFLTNLTGKNTKPNTISFPEIVAYAPYPSPTILACAHFQCDILY